MSSIQQGIERLLGVISETCTSQEVSDKELRAVGKSNSLLYKLNAMLGLNGLRTTFVLAIALTGRKVV